MAIHDDAEMPEELPIEIKSSENASSSCNFLQNQFQEYSSTADKLSIMSNCGNKSPEISCTLFNAKMQKSKKKSKKNNNENACGVTEISAEDLEELKKTYKQCKSVLKKIEIKYGHLLDLELEGPSEKRRKHTIDEYQEKVECQCTLNKKIVFDDDGKEVTIDSAASIHICPNKLMLNKNQNVNIPHENMNIHIEYHNKDIELTDNLQELHDILQNPNIETIYRNQVIDKLRSIKQEYLNEIKFNKSSLIEKMKANSDELLNFKGSNLSVLSGYLYYK